MAGVEFKKYAMSQAGELEVHYDSEIRANERVHHSNRNINPALTHLNYYIGASNYQDIVQRMERAVERADAEHPPQRVKKDRKHWYILNVPCPPELEGTKEEDIFYKKVYEMYREYLPIAGAAIHKDEGHEYYDYRKDKDVVSRNHMDIMGACITPDGRCNCKALISPQMCKKVNDDVQKMCLEEWGISYQTGEGRKGKYKSVEQLKQESQVALETKLAKEGLEVVQELRQEKKDLQKDVSELKEIEAATTSHISMQDKQIERNQKTIDLQNAEIAAKKEEAGKIEKALERLQSAIKHLLEQLAALKPKQRDREKDIFAWLEKHGKVMGKESPEEINAKAEYVEKQSDRIEADYLSLDDDDFEL